MSTKPTIILIPGAWHTTEGFGPLKSFLEKAGYPTKAVDLPSAGAHPGHPNFNQDVAVIRKVVLDSINEKKEVVVVMHSFGSVIGSEALRDLGKEDREATGKTGGVIRCIFIGILLPELGKAMNETYLNVMSAPDLDPDFEVEQDQSSFVVAEDGTSTITDVETRFYDDLPPEEAKFWAGKLTSCSLGCMASPLTYQAWKHIPSAYIMCLKDRSIPLRQVRRVVKKVGIGVVLECESGHCPFLSKTEEVGNVVRKTAGEVVA